MRVSAPASLYAHPAPHRLARRANIEDAGPAEPIGECHGHAAALTGMGRVRRVRMGDRIRHRRARLSRTRREAWIAGTFQDPAAMRRASLMAGVGILLAVLGVILSSSTVGLRATKRRSSPGTSCSTSPGFSGSGCWSARNAALQPPLRRLCPCGTAARDHHRRGDACPDAVLLHPGRREQRVIVRRSQRRRLVHCYWSRIRSRAMVWSLDSGALDERRTVMTEACCRRGAFLASKASPISG
jgi:hypothetical protein